MPTKIEPTVKVWTVGYMALAYGNQKIVLPEEEAKELAVLIFQNIEASSVEQESREP